MINKNQVTQFHFLLIPVINVIANRIHQDRAFWGIRFPVYASSPDKTIINVIQEYLEGGWHMMLHPGRKGLDEAAILLAVIVKADGKFIKHKKLISVI